MNHSKAYPRAGSSERGITLVELMVVLFVVAVGAILALENLNGMYRKFELESSVQQLAAFLDAVPTQARQQNRELFIVWNLDDDVRTIQVVDGFDVDSHLISSLVLEDFLVVEPLDPSGFPEYFICDEMNAADVPAYFRCDTMGRTYTESDMTMMDTVQVYRVTHELVVSGDLNPPIAYAFSLSPLWNITIEKGILGES